MKTSVALFGLLFTLMSLDSLADVSLLIHETAVVSRPAKALGGILTQNGHAAIELHNACLVDNNPTHLKLCDSSDLHHGVVIGQYLNVLPEHYQWVAIPTNYYLYGVPDESQKPLIATDQISRAIEHNGFNRFIADITTLRPDHSAPEEWRWRWRFSFGQSLKREIYRLRFTTTLAENLELIAVLNESTNVGPKLIGALTSNCSDFSQEILRHVLEPDAPRKRFGLVLNSPKGVAERLLHSTGNVSERGFRIEKVFQIPGHSQSLKVDNARAISAKGFVVYQLLIADIPLAVIGLAAYWHATRFNLHDRYLENLDIHSKLNNMFESKKHWKERDRTFKSIMAKQTNCSAVKPLAPFKDHSAHVDIDGSVRLLGAHEQFIETDFSGVSASS
ncbi:MAG: hypothetical protein O7E57_14455, partial [Gammaproteobacteria bacterium]|nr:hypothetical protein [Gammaproteobacteria bacterium]